MLPWRNIFLCPRRRGPCRWSIFAICPKTQPTRCSARCGGKILTALRSAPIAAAPPSIPIGVVACSNARPAIVSFQRRAEPYSRTASLRFELCSWRSAWPSVLRDGHQPPVRPLAPFARGHIRNALRAGSRYVEFVSHLPDCSPLPRLAGTMLRRSCTGHSLRAGGKSRTRRRGAYRPRRTRNQSGRSRTERLACHASAHPCRITARSCEHAPASSCKTYPTAGVAAPVASRCSSSTSHLRSVSINTLEGSLTASSKIGPPNVRRIKPESFMSFDDQLPSLQHAILGASIRPRSDRTVESPAAI